MAIATGETVLGDAKIRLRLDDSDIKGQIAKSEERVKKEEVKERDVKRERKKAKEEDKKFKKTRLLSAGQRVTSALGVRSPLLRGAGVVAGGIGILKIVEQLVPLVMLKVADLIPGITAGAALEASRAVSDQITKLESKILAGVSAVGQTKDISLARLRLGDDVDFQDITKMLKIIHEVESAKRTLEANVRKSKFQRDWQNSTKAFWKAIYQ